MVRAPVGCCLVLASSLLAASAHAAGPGAGHGVVSSRHPERGVPQMLWSTSSVAAPAGMSAEQAARFHLERVRGAYATSRAAVAATRALFVHDTGRGGVIVALRPTRDGVDVLHSDVKLLLDRSHRLLAISGSPHPGAGVGAAFTSADGRVAAAGAALRAHTGLELAAHLAPVAARGGSEYLELAAPAPVDLRLRRPARVMAVYLPVGAALVPAHYVEVDAQQGTAPRRAFAYVVGLDGAILERRDLVAHAAFKYRVLADADDRPLDGPLEDWTPHPLGEPEGGPTQPAESRVVTMEGFNTNPDGGVDPWLPAGATETLGNNVDAYVDHLSPTGLSLPLGDFRAAVSSAGTFDYSYDIAVEPLTTAEQSSAAVVSLFYTNNWLHDWFYDSGFNEAAGNAQADNFGRGGVDGDVLLAEGQDGAYAGDRDNANMQTPLDGDSPIMQMYLWSPEHRELKLTTSAPDMEFEVGQALFGPRKYDVEAELVLYDDGAGENPNDGCEAPVDPEALAGKIALIDRGTCSFETKATFAQAAGAVGVVFPDLLSNMGPYPPGPPDPMLVDPTIPGQGLPKADGQLLKDAMLAGTVTARMFGNTSVERDGTIDNLIVAHEWGHYLHHRLVDCSSLQCAGHSEGWGDFNALVLALREGDDLDGTYASAAYGGFDPTGYFALRRVAYTVDMAKNPFTFKHIQEGVAIGGPPYVVANGITNAESHNAGEVWCTTMWEVYVGLHKANAGAKSFEEVHRDLTDYVVAGMMLTPVDPTYTEQRDAILAAIYAQDPDDAVTAAEAFARRGMGTCAVSPERYSGDLKGVVEDFEIRPSGALIAATLDDKADSCDQDGILDAGEAGTITVTVRNPGIVPLVGATLSASSVSATLTFPEGDSVPVPELAPQTETTVTYAVALEGAVDVENAVVNFALTVPNGCEEAVELPLSAILNGDLGTKVSAVDDVESEASPWVFSGDPKEEVEWVRVARPSSYVWHSDNPSVQTDGFLASPQLEVAADMPFTLSFDHAHAFEYAPQDDPEFPFIYWDGGIVEISADNGQTWEDVKEFVATAPYNGEINSGSNPLNGRSAFVGQNESYPAPDKVTLDLGDAFAGKKVRVRFRMATDSGGSAPGWDVDNIAFTGITNTPFPRWDADPDACGTADSTPTTSDTEAGSEDSSDTDDDPGADVGDGCGCAAAPVPGLLPWFGVLALRRRRRAVR